MRVQQSDISAAPCSGVPFKFRSKNIKVRRCVEALEKQDLAIINFVLFNGEGRTYVKKKHKKFT